MPSPWTDELIARMRALVKAEWSFGEIAKTFGNGLSRNAVIGKAHRLGLVSRNKKHAPARQTVEDRIAVKRKRVRYHIGEQDQFNKPYVEEIIPPAIKDTEIPRAQRKSLLQLGEHDCRFPVGEVSDPEFFFCGAAAVEGSPYCAQHSRRCFTHAPPRTHSLRPRV